MFGRFLLSQDVIQILSEIPLGKSNELWLTDAVREYVKRGGRVVVNPVTDGEWLTIGDPLKRQISRKREISDAEFRLVRIGVDHEWIPASPKIRCVVEMIVGAAPEVRYGDVGRHPRMIRPADAGHNRAQSGPALL